MLSDIFPTGYFGAELAEVSDGDSVAVFGCGPVGQFAIVSAFILDAGLVRLRGGQRPLAPGDGEGPGRPPGELR